MNKIVLLYLLFAIPLVVIFSIITVIQDIENNLGRSEVHLDSIEQNIIELQIELDKLDDNLDKLEQIERRMKP